MTKQRGVAQVVLLGLMVVTFVGLLGTSVLVKKNQDIRNRAMDVECQSSSECPDGLVCKDFYCVKPGQTKKCRDGEVQRCSINGRAGQKECVSGKWSKCIETSSGVQGKCGMTSIELKMAEKNCQNQGLVWKLSICSCQKTNSVHSLSRCEVTEDCPLLNQVCINKYCEYRQFANVTAGVVLSPTPTSTKWAVGYSCYGDMVGGKYIDTCPDGFICIDSTCREPPGDVDDGSWIPYDMCLDLGCEWDILNSKCNCSDE